MRVTSPYKPGPREPIELQRGDRAETVWVDGSSVLFVRQVEDFVAAALDGRSPVVSLADSRGVAAALAALHRSVELQRPVQL